MVDIEGGHQMVDIELRWWTLNPPFHANQTKEETEVSARQMSHFQAWIQKSRVLLKLLESFQFTRILSLGHFPWKHLVTGNN
jgi:hypothetical protein